MIALIDCNSFFCGCERVFEPTLRNSPVIVLSNNDGCAIARTPEAKKLGIKMGDPYFKIRKLCQDNGVAVYSSNFSLYTDMSRRVMKLLRAYSSKVEVYSVDEAFIDLTEFTDLEEYAQAIKKEVEQQTKISISIGIAKTKVLAKIACRVAKKDPEKKGVYLLPEKGQNECLQQIPVEKIWGIARGRALRLSLLGIKTAYDLKTYKNTKIIQKELTKSGRMIQEELNGIVCFDLEESVTKKKEVMSSRTFSSSVYDFKTLSESVSSHASSVAQELRSQHSVCNEILVYVRSNPFKETIQYAKSEVLRFSTPTSSTFRIIEKALECLDTLWRPGIEYKKAGVRVSRLQDKNEHLLSLFCLPDSEREDTLMRTMDRINHLEGPRTLESLACGTKGFAWEMARRHLSPRYTTSWNDLPKCLCK